MEREEFDYIVVGAGSSGCVVANRLSEEPGSTVLVLEAGGPDTHPFIKMPLAFLMAMMNPRFNWGYVTEPEAALAGRQLFLPRGRVVGGSSSINGMFYMRGHPRDFEEWRELGAAGWGYADVLPYFRRMETSWRGAGRYHGGSGPLHVVPIDTTSLMHEELMDAGRAAGFPISEDLSAERPEGFARGEVTIDLRGRRASAASAYLRPALTRPNLSLRANALVHRVIFRDGRAQGVEYDAGSGVRTVFARREVILSGGTYNSPHLLMLSGIGPGQMLADLGIAVVCDNASVGRNLSEHTTAPVEWDATGPITFLNQLRMDRLLRSALQWALRGTGPLASQVNSANVVIRTDSTLERPDIQLMTSPIKLDAKPWLPLLGKPQPHVFWAGVVLLHPQSRGHIALKSKDPRVLPAIHLNLLSDAADYLPLRRGIRAARAIYRSGRQARLTGPERLPGAPVQSDAELDAFIRQFAYVAQHPVGTCTMGGRHQVVDPQLRVVGVERLRVVDASVMPTVPGANTNAAAIMLGEKAADLIRGRHPPIS